MKISTLKKMPFFSDISDEVLTLLLPAFRKENYRPGEVIFEEGFLADTFFIIQKGEVIVRKVISGEEVRHKLIAILAEGELLGEMAAFQGQPRSAQAVAKTTVTLLKIHRDDIFNLFKKDQHTAAMIMDFLISILMGRLRNTTKELATIYETGRLVTSAQDIAVLSNSVMDRISRDIDAADAGLFAVWNEFNEDFEVCAEKGFGLSEKQYLSAEEPIIRWLDENRESFLSFDALKEKRVEIGAGCFIKGMSILASPFITNDRMNGFLVLINRRRKNAFSYNHVVMLSAVSGYVSVALENMKYKREDIDRFRLSQAKTSVYF